MAPGLDQPWCVQQGQGSHHPPVLGTAEATPPVLCPVLGFEKGREGQQSWEGSGAQESDKEQGGSWGCLAWRQ